jgi:hypothetical protein
VLAAALACVTTTAAGQSYDVRAELWDRPRTAAAVAADDGVRQAVLEILARPQSRMAIRHGAGQEAALQAEELRSWLGALAIDPRRIELRSDLAGAAVLKLEIAP